MLLKEEAATEELVENMLSWRHTGFSCYVGRAQAGRNTDKLESLAQYISRGAVALERMTLTADTNSPGKVIYRSNKVHPGHGANFRIFDPLDFIAHLSAHIPSRHEKHVIWYGGYSNKNRGMRKKAALAGEDNELSEAERAASEEEKAPLNVRRAWAYLVSRVYEVDPLVCPSCGGEMKIISYIHESDVIFRILDHLGLLVEEVPALAERAPPGITYEPFFDDLPPGETDEELVDAVVNVGGN
jgi:hypothetical protein